MSASIAVRFRSGEERVIRVPDRREFIGQWSRALDGQGEGRALSVVEVAYHVKGHPERVVLIDLAAIEQIQGGVDEP